MFSRVVAAGALLWMAACSASRASSGNKPVPSNAETTPSWRRAFDQRRAAGHGIFLTEEEIKNAKAATLVTLLQHIPSVRVTCRTVGCDVSLLRAPEACPPAFIVDGVPAIYSPDVDLSSADIMGIEIYRTRIETPSEFLGAANSCGTIVIWTRFRR